MDYENDKITIAKMLEKEQSEKITSFYSEIKSLESKDINMTSEHQINRLNRQGSAYFNLNPFDVLQLDPDDLTDLKSRYRKLSLLVHPDKNPDNVERAQRAFEAVKKSHQKLQSFDDRKNCLEIVREAKQRAQKKFDEQNKNAKKYGGPSGDPLPSVFKQEVYRQTCIIFADLERLRVTEENKQLNERKRKAEEEEDARLTVELKNEWEKNYDESRTERIHSWKSFTAKKAKTGKPL
ncbi:DnaJ (Hsp40), subfamily C, member 8, partial [Cichlidogyrus casuarinus]